jgi:hypothetical protein
MREYLVIVEIDTSPGAPAVPTFLESASPGCYDGD